VLDALRGTEKGKDAEFCDERDKEGGDADTGWRQKNCGASDRRPGAEDMLMPNIFSKRFLLHSLQNRFPIFTSPIKSSMKNAHEFYACTSSFLSPLSDISPLFPISHARMARINLNPAVQPCDPALTESMRVQKRLNSYQPLLYRLRLRLSSLSRQSFLNDLQSLVHRI